MTRHIQRATVDERRAALRVGADLLASVFPRMMVDGQVSIGGNSFDVRATQDSTGRQRVVRRHDGCLVAQTGPARFGTLDAELSDRAMPPEGRLGSELSEWYGATDFLGHLADYCRQADEQGLSLAELARHMDDWAEQLDPNAAPDSAAEDPAKGGTPPL